MRGAKQIFGEKMAGRRLLVPEHHQHDELQLIERERRPGSGERALENELARFGRQDARLLQRDDETPALRVELCQLARGKGAKAGA